MTICLNNVMAHLKIETNCMKLPICWNLISISDGARTHCIIMVILESMIGENLIPTI